MNAPEGMREHGIMTTKAEYWVHLFPLSYEVFWYRVEHCRQYIERKKVPIKLGTSADGTPTGNGYLIPKTAYFVKREEVPVKYIDHADWRDMTDRQLGFNGEPIVGVLFEHRIIVIPPSRASLLRSKEAQFNATDFGVRWTHPFTFETKTERRSDTANLYVQTHEGGHRVNQLRDEEATERVTEAPGFADEEIPF